MHVDARDLAFTEAADGMRLAQLEVMAMTFGDNGQVADQHNRRYTVRLTAERHAQALETGFVYNLRMPVKRPGPISCAVALRDVGADRIGSASQFIDVPDLGRRQLTLSSLFIQGLGAGGTTDGAVEVLDPDATVAVRRFRRSALTTYVCYAYNVARDSSGKSRVESEARLLRDGVEVFRSGPHPAQTSTDPNELPRRRHSAARSGHHTRQLSPGAHGHRPRGKDPAARDADHRFRVIDSSYGASSRAGEVQKQLDADDS